jgi:hypothetical protein
MWGDDIDKVLRSRFINRVYESYIQTSRDRLFEEGWELLSFKRIFGSSEY